MKITFWGTRGSIASPGRDTAIYGGNTTCLEIVLNSGRRVVVDAGTGIRVLGEQLSKGKEKVDIHLLITHIHWDHVLGFPFFKPLYDPSTKIRVDGYPTCMKGLRFTFDNKMGDGFFPVKFSELKAQIPFSTHRAGSDTVSGKGTRLSCSSRTMNSGQMPGRGPIPRIMPGSAGVQIF
jgi:phosphoribosyl 1,2-cyclic phosphodiesterase